MRSIAILAAGFFVLAASAMADDPAPKIITAVGTAKVEVVPDRATINIGVETADKVTVKAVAANSALMAKVVDAVKALGIPETAIQTSDFSITAQHPRNKDGYSSDTTVTLGYEVSNVLAIKVEDVAKVPLVIDAAVKAGANTSNSVVFEAKNRKALKDVVLAQAIKDARHNAEVMAAAAGAKVGKAIVVQQGLIPDADDIARLPNQLIEDRKEEAAIIMAGQVGISATVTVQYLLE